VFVSDATLDRSLPLAAPRTPQLNEPTAQIRLSLPGTNVFSVRSFAFAFGQANNTCVPGGLQEGVIYLDPVVCRVGAK
jgi:hypothetical protein